MIRKIKIALTMGEPEGIGPEITLKCLNHLPTNIELFLLAQPQVYYQLAKSLNINIKKLNIIPPLNKSNPIIGSIELACKLTYKGFFDAMVTNPINKWKLWNKGFNFPGHTEFLAHLTKTKNYAMLYWLKPFKILFLTTHIPLKDVVYKIDKNLILNKLNLIADNLWMFDQKPLKVALSCINPHCGEKGKLSKEENIIYEAIELFHNENIKIFGPFSPDTVFYQALKNKYELIIVPYHDLGSVVAKTFFFYDTVNITIGLPIIRTSVDHGSAEDIAGKNIASPENLIKAIILARDLYLRKKSYYI